MKTTDTYKEAHPYCEACTLARKTDEVHHIRTRGAGGDDSDRNLLALCKAHHGMVHAMGIVSFQKMVPRLEGKIKAARAAPRVLRGKEGGGGWGA